MDRDDDQDDQDDRDVFELRNDPPKRTQRPATFDDQEKTLQRVLIDGLDCLAGQQDLF